MLKSKLPSKKSALIAGIGAFMFLVVNFSISTAAESGCVTCHLDKEMLKKNITAQKGTKSAMQSGAG